MSKIDDLSIIDLSHCLARAEALIQVLGESAIGNGNTHQVIMIEVIEEYLLKARKLLGDR